jgi:AraC family transcriptional activator FtrA
LPRNAVRLCSPRGPILRTDIGVDLRVEAGLAALCWADTIVVPSAPKGIMLGGLDPVVRALRAAHRRGARIATFCSGAFVLAATGLLDGRRATTHWLHADRFAERFPGVELDRDVLYVDAGDGLAISSTVISRGGRR